VITQKLYAAELLSLCHVLGPVSLCHSKTAQNVLKVLPMTKPHAGRTIVALVAAYAVALQAILIVFAGPVAGTAALADQPICSFVGLGGAGKTPAGGGGPAGHTHDCLAACTAGCCAAAGGLQPTATAALAAPRSAPVAALHRVAPPSAQTATGAHRSRAPPLG
jgi:hypothetical protein